jgi:hypothetical protein
MMAAGRAKASMLALPAIFAFALAAAVFLFGRRVAGAVAALAGAILAVHLWSATPFPRNERLGYPELVESLLAGPDRNRRVYLIAGDALREGGFIGGRKSAMVAGRRAAGHPHVPPHRARAPRSAASQN